MSFNLPLVAENFLEALQLRPETEIQELVKPYNKCDTHLRKIFAQDLAQAERLADLVNVVTLYNGDQSTEIHVRARHVGLESDNQNRPQDKKGANDQRKDDNENQKYIFPLSKSARRENGSPAIVPSLAEFQKNFDVFTEGLLCNLDWGNVIAAGGAVVTPLMPVPQHASKSKENLRDYYHNVYAPDSDVDLFLYGLTEMEAIAKIEAIEKCIRNEVRDSAFGHQTTTVRTKNTITIISQFPRRHVQIVLRLYRSIAEILTGFDVDCCCAAYDGKQVYASPRAIAAYITQINQIDLTRRSPSFENRLAKYARRGFEVFWGSLDRSKIDPAIFDGKIADTKGLARLLVLEMFPKESGRVDYEKTRRELRGDPAINPDISRNRRKGLVDDIKEVWEDEILEHQGSDKTSNYDTFGIPYGPKWTPVKIEQLFINRDKFLNYRCTQPGASITRLHRHPAFVGLIDKVLMDYCNNCPKPQTKEEQNFVEGYVSGEVSFIKDGPGRQQIGSFNPVSATGWTEMAYIGQKARLCQAIVSQNLNKVEGFLEKVHVDSRDCTGRTFLQLACMVSTPEIVNCLVERGAQLTTRMANGKTALHLAAERGNVDILHILLQKSGENRENPKSNPVLADIQPTDDDAGCRHGDGLEFGASRAASDDLYSNNGSTTNHQVDQAYRGAKETVHDLDVYDIDYPAEDSLTTPLHLAILHGHIDATNALIETFEAGVDIPIYVPNEETGRTEATIPNLLLVCALPYEDAKKMLLQLLERGASPLKPDYAKWSALNYFSRSDYCALLRVFEKYVKAEDIKRAVNFLVMEKNHLETLDTLSSPLAEAIAARRPDVADILLKMRASPSVDEVNLPQLYPDGLHGVKQPLLCATIYTLPSIALHLLPHVDDPNMRFTVGKMQGWTILDGVQDQLEKLQSSLALTLTAKNRETSRVAEAIRMAAEVKAAGHYQESSTTEEKIRRVHELIDTFGEVQRMLWTRGAKTQQQLDQMSILHAAVDTLCQISPICNGLRVIYSHPHVQLLESSWRRMVETLRDKRTQFPQRLAPLGEGYISDPPPSRSVYEEHLSPDPSHAECAKAVPIKSLIQAAISHNNLTMLEEQLTLYIDETCSYPSGSSLVEEFQLAICLGRTDCLAKIIRVTGFGLPPAMPEGELSDQVPPPYDSLKTSPCKSDQTTNAWQPASVGPLEDHSPLLISAMQGVCSSTEWFLGGEPALLYTDYVSRHLEDRRVQRLSRFNIKLGDSVEAWLSTRKNLVLHCAVMSKPCEESLKLVRRLAKDYPEYLEAYSAEGHTPLALAYGLRRPKFAKILIENGANQNTLDRKGRNLIHLLLVPLQPQTRTDFEAVSSLFNLLDPQHIPKMLVWRAGHHDRSTPLAWWLESYRPVHSGPKDQSKYMSSTMTLILDLASPINQKPLELLDGSGNTPLHQAATSGFPGLLEQMLNLRPDLLYQENADGNTVIELARDIWVHHTTHHPPHGEHGIHTENMLSRLTRGPDPFSDVQRECFKSKPERVLEICRKYWKPSPGDPQVAEARRLLSPFQALETTRNLVSKAQYATKSYKSRSDSGPQPVVWVDQAALWRILVSS